MPVVKKTDRCLGAGAAGSVFLGFDTDRGVPVAVKEIPIPQDCFAAQAPRGFDAARIAAQSPGRTPQGGAMTPLQRVHSAPDATGGASTPSKPDPTYLQKIKREFLLLEGYDHPNIVRFLDCQQSDEHPHILQLVMEYIPGGSLADVVRTFGPVKEAIAHAYTRDILCGIDYLHNICRICHRDIKGANVLLTANGRCKLSDFGTAKIFSSTYCFNTIVGTPSFMAPEVVKGETYGKAADIWSLGCTVYEMLAGKPPWAHLGNPMAVMFRAASTEELPELPPEIHGSISPQCLDFIAVCFVRDQSKRATVDELLCHPWIVGEPSDELKRPSSRQLESSIQHVGTSGRHTPPEESSDQGPTGAGALVIGPSPTKPKNPADLPEERRCHICREGYALFSCDACRIIAARQQQREAKKELQLQQQLTASGAPQAVPTKQKPIVSFQYCPACWDIVHASDATRAHHKKDPLLFGRGDASPLGTGLMLAGGTYVMGQGGSDCGDVTSTVSGHSGALGDEEDEERDDWGCVQQWQCGRCTFLNPNRLDACEMCGHSR